MEWFVDARRPEAVHDLRREIGAYLERHAAPGADVAGAQLAFGELLSNLSRHAPGPAWVSVNWPGDSVAVVVTDLGPGIVDVPPEVADRLAESGRGLLILDAVSEGLSVRSRDHGGARVALRIPLARRGEVSHDPLPSTAALLPELSEARPEGAFGRESFLRALVVQLAQSVESACGPSAAERAVAQVGVNVGTQMEQEYRRAASIVGRLSAAQVADCLVRLKNAIDGGFRVTELTEDRIVLSNTACPFGPVVQRAPALCRMTSSVFGGIAARNSTTEQSAVVLEERIATGDPFCRVVVHFGPPPEHVRPFAHAYTGQPSG